MTAHISDELPGLLTGEASRDVVLSAAEHLRTCVDCQHELVSAVVSHASLMSAQRFAPDVVTPAPAPEPPVAAPDLSAMFGEIRAEVEADRRAGRRRRTGAIAAAAAAVVVLGGGAAIWAATSGGDDNASARTVALGAYGVGRSDATATIHDTTMTIDASSLPTLASRRYEVWLTDSGRTRMQPIGWIGNDGTARINVPSALMSRFQDVEISVQDVDAKSYDYSGTSVLRGSLE